MAVLIDTNIVVYRFDPRFPAKQQRATALLRQRIEDDTARLPHQAIIEFVAAVTRHRREGGPLLTIEDALHEADAFLSHFVVLYPNEDIVRLAIQGHAAYQLPWFDAHLLAYAEYYGLEQILSEDF